MKTIGKAVSAFKDYLLPSHCFSCSRAVEGGAVICRECYKEIEKTKDNVCDKCGMQKKNCVCKRFVYHFSGVTAPFRNEGVAQRGLYGIKFMSDEACVDFYAQHMVQRLKSRKINLNFDFVTFVPMNFIKRADRGYNQAELLANSVAKRLGIEVKGNVLYRSILSRTQHTFDGVNDRFLNAYKSYRRKNKKVSGRVLLVDDIKTTGASLEACARELLYAGADEVFCLTALISDKNS